MGCSRTRRISGWEDGGAASGDGGVGNAVSHGGYRGGGDGGGDGSGIGGGVHGGDGRGQVMLVVVL